MPSPSDSALPLRRGGGSAVTSGVSVILVVSKKGLHFLYGERAVLIFSCGFFFLVFFSLLKRWGQSSYPWPSLRLLPVPAESGRGSVDKGLGPFALFS